MAQNITLLGASYSDVPAVSLPKTGGGTASFDDTTDATATADKILSGYTAYANGVKLTGTATGGGSVTQDQDGFLVIPPDGSGGGSSDFSTATVTVNASEFGVDVIPVFIADDAIMSDAAIIGETYTVPLYKNECRWLLMNQYTVTVSGNATYDAENGVIIITGDCTITVS